MGKVESLSNKELELLRDTKESREFEIEDQPRETATSLQDRPGINLRTYIAQPEALRLIPESVARQYKVMPLSISNGALRVAMANPKDFWAIEALGARARMRIEPILATPKEIQEALDFNYRACHELEKQLDRTFKAIKQQGKGEEAKEITDESPAVHAVNIIIEEAVKSRCSDIHIEPQEDRLRIRYRIDGVLHDVASLPLEAHSSLISRIKILAGMNIADYHRPQDGQLSIKTGGRVIDIRVATAYTSYGEMAVLRILDKAFTALPLAELGLLHDSLEKYEHMLKIPYGMLLVSGPTGSGKTTTLYASINRLDHIGRNIITLEDPVEYRFKNINQIQINPRAGLTFATGIRSILRLDPDVILVGEIRDAETAKTAIQAALTGHLVLSSVHANNAIGALFRLMDLGVEPFLIASTLIGVIAQRMVRRVCPHCQCLTNVSLEEQLVYYKEMGEMQDKFLYGGGCPICANTGYFGRTAVFEILALSDVIRRMVVTGATLAQIRAQAVKEGMRLMAKDGMLKVKLGITTPYEVLRNVSSIEEV